MAGTKTRFGYLGGNGEEPPDAGDAAPARTVIGHDIHLPPTPAGNTPSSTPVPPASRARMAMAPFVRAPIVAPMPEARTEAIPERQARRSQPSRLARFLGRWTTGGHFRSDNSFGAAHLTDEDLRLPRDTAARNVLLVMAIAALTFLVTFAIMKWRDPHGAPRATQPPVVAPARMAAPALIPTVAPAAAPAPATPAQPAAAEPAKRALPPKAHKPSSAGTPPPEHLKNELLPMQP